MEHITCLSCSNPIAAEDAGLCPQCTALQHWARAELADSQSPLRSSEGVYALTPLFGEHAGCLERACVTCRSIRNLGAGWARADWDPRKALERYTPPWVRLHIQLGREFTERERAQFQHGYYSELHTLLCEHELGRRRPPATAMSTAAAALQLYLRLAPSDADAQATQAVAHVAAWLLAQSRLPL